MSTKRVPLDYLEDVYLFHCVTQSFRCTWSQSRVDGWITCHHTGDMMSCAFPVPSPKRSVHVGVRVEDGRYEVFRPNSEPTEITHGNIYKYSIGPFKTVRGAEWMVSHPGIAVSVDQAERLARTCPNCQDPENRARGYVERWGNKCPDCGRVIKPKRAS